MTTGLYQNTNDLFFALSDANELESLLGTLGEVVIDKFDYNGFSLPAILQSILTNATNAKRTKAELFKDLVDIIIIGLVRGNIRQNQLGKTVDTGKARIQELAKIYLIPMRKSITDKVNLLPGTLTFTRSLTCFPHIASLILFKSPQIAKDGSSSNLQSRILPACMKHSGFSGLVPSKCHAGLTTLYLLAHTAYMIDFGHSINPKDFVSIQDSYQKQLNFGRIAVENSPYSDELRIGYLRTLGLATPATFRIILEVANRLLKEVGKKELAIEEYVKSYVKNSIVYYTEDEKMETDSAKKIQTLFDKLLIVEANPKITNAAEIGSSQTNLEIEC